MPISKKWFCEDAVPGKRFKKVKHCFSIDKLIFEGKTDYQKVLIFENSVYGRVFCLDDIAQLSECDEFIYHEMMVHPLLLSHPNPQNILIIGGGDGGVLREVLKYPIRKADLVESDKEIIKISKKYLRFVCKSSFSDKRLKVFNCPGEEFIAKTKKISQSDLYDAAIIDCTNPSPESSSLSLYSTKFYRSIFNSLKEEGMIVVLGASFLDFNDFVKPISKNLKKVFPFVSLFRFCMPSYHCGEYCFAAASKKIDLNKIDYAKIEKKFKNLQKKSDFKYYSPEIHRASAALPKLWETND